MAERFVKISYTGKIKDTGRVFDTTDENTAEEAGIKKEGHVFTPISLVIGAGQIIKGLDDALEKMKSGDEKSIEIPPQEAFGKRNPELIKLVPMRVFKEQKMTPVPGMAVELDGKPARIQTVSGGRIRVDFNSELAGKTVIFDVKVEGEAKNQEDRIMYLIERSFDFSDDFKTDVLNGKKLKLTIPEKAFKDRAVLLKKASLAAELFKFFDFKEITFEEVWIKK